MNYYHRDMEKELKLISFDDRQWVFKYETKEGAVEKPYAIETVNFLLQNEILVRSEILLGMIIGVTTRFVLPILNRRR